jgi:hypothetical protein
MCGKLEKEIESDEVLRSISKEINILVHYLKYLKSEVGYDFESGLNLAISNTVNGLGGTNLTFAMASSSNDKIKIGSGTFQIGRENLIYKELIYFNGKNEVGGIILIGPQNALTTSLIEKIITSTEYLF